MEFFNKKGIKTTIVAFILLAISIALIAALVLDKITLTELTTIMSLLGVFGATIIGFLSKDQNKSHTMK